MENNSSTVAVAFLAGALMGAGVALLLAPQAGAELRGMLSSYASRAGEDLRERGQRTWATTVERGTEYLESGRQTMRESGQAARDYVEKGQQAIRQATETAGRG